MSTQYCSFLVHPQEPTRAYNLRDMPDSIAAWTEAQHHAFGAWGHYTRVSKQQAPDGVAGLAIMGRRGGPKPRLLTSAAHELQE